MMNRLLLPMIDDAVTTNKTAETQGVGYGPEDNHIEEAENPGVENPGEENTVEENPRVIPPIVDHDQEEIPADSKEMPVDNIEQVTEHDQFESAVVEGHARAQIHNNMQPRRTHPTQSMMKMMITSLLASNPEAGLSDDTL
jgi:hypothetical protein